MFFSCTVVSTLTFLNSDTLMNPSLTAAEIISLRSPSIPSSPILAPISHIKHNRIYLYK
jgi:hypothetical protein